MTGRELAVVAFKVLAVWTMTTAVRDLRMLLGGLAYRVEEFDVIPAIVSISIPIAIGLLLWRKAQWLTDRILLVSSGEPSESRLETEDWFAIACSVIGLVLLARALPETLYWVFLYAASLTAQESVLGNAPLPSEEYGRLFDLQAKATMATVVTRLIIGMGLVVGAKSVGQLMTVFKEEGLGLTSREELEPDQEGGPSGAPPEVKDAE